MQKSLLRKVRSVLGNFKTLTLFPKAPPTRPFAKLPVFSQVREDMVGRGETATVIDPLLKHIAATNPLAERYDILKTLHQQHPHPHQVNYLLGQEEYQRGIAAMTAYPSYVLMDISNICTVECRFCKYTHQHLDKKWLTLDQIKQIEWFDYPLYLNFTSGTAEALSNPQFVPIFQYIRSRFPHLILGLLTNGRTLNEKVLRALIGNLSELHISMNASTEEDYDRIIANGSWDLFSRNMKLVRDLLKTTNKPWMQASFVKMRWNLDRALREVEFAVAHGARKVLFHHYYPHFIHDLHQGNQKVLAEKFRPEESLYFDQERSDEVFARVRERGKELGVEVETPPPFSAPAKILWGARTLSEPPRDCAYPWTHMFMLWGWKSKREEITMCCGLASDTGIYFDWDKIFTKQGVFETWNSPTMQAYRRTVNGNKVNPICALCRKIDRFSPDAIYPDQRKFFLFNDLPIPEHFKKGKWFELPMASGTGGGGCCG